jgi:hypothetical protein
VVPAPQKPRRSIGPSGIGRVKLPAYHQQTPPEQVAAVTLCS